MKSVKPAKKPVSKPQKATKNTEAVLETLFQVIKSRKKANPDTSYVASLFERGVEKIAQKVGEEAVETALAAVVAPVKKQKIAEESADLLFHLLVLWAKTGVSPENVWDVLQKRENISGLAEKKARTAIKKPKKAKK